MRWEPDQSMTDHDEALPFGKLALAVVSVDPPAPIKEVTWEVPTKIDHIELYYALICFNIPGKP